MPLLEQHRRAPGAAAARFLTRPLLLPAERLTVRLWPALWSACFLAGATAGAAWGTAVPAAWGAPGVARGAALLTLLLSWRRAPAWAVGLLVVAAAGAWGAGRAEALRAVPVVSCPRPLAPSQPAGGRGAAVLRISGHASPRAGGGWRAPARVLAAAGRAGAPPVRGAGLLLAGDGPAPCAGDVVSAALSWRRPRPADTAGGFDDRAYLAGRGLAWRAWTDGVRVRRASATGRAVTRVRAGLASALAGLLPPREAGLASAVLLGWRAPDHRHATAAFAELGLAHLFAVSGLHVGVLVALLVLPLRAAGVPAALAAPLLAAAVGLYVLLTGMPGSVVRAGGAVALAAGTAALGRPADGLRLLGVLFWLLVLTEPARALDTGVRLSYLAAGGILTLHRVRPLGVSGPRTWLAGAAGVSAAAQWATLPAVASSFGGLHPLATAANVVAVPAFAAAVWLLALALACQPLAAAVAADLAALAWLLLRALAGLTAAAAPASAGLRLGMPPPGPGALACWAALTCALAAVARRGGRTTALVVPLLAAGVAAFAWPGRLLPPKGAPVAVQFAVGQADAALVAFPDGWCALLDTGDRGRRPGGGAFARTVAPWLRRHGVRRLDAVVLTHGHADHVGGAADLAGAFAVGRWHGGGRAGARVATGPAPWAIPRRRRVLHAWGAWRLEVLDPGVGGARPAGENDASLVTVLWRGDAAAMVWSGDLEHGGEAALLAAGAVPAGVQVWKAGHHGSRTAGGAPFLDRLRPRLVLLSCGVGNRHGHPDHGPYVAAGDTVPVLRTDLAGTLVLRWDRDGALAVRPRRGPGADLTPPGRVSTMRPPDPTLMRRPVRDGRSGG